MGAFHLSRLETISLLGEIVGYKAGLILSREDIQRHIPDYKEIWSGSDDDILRIRSEYLEEIVCGLLFGVGNISSPRRIFPGIALYHKYKNDFEKNKIRHLVVDYFVEYMNRKKMSDKPSDIQGPVDLTEFVVTASELFGPIGAKIALEYAESLQESLHQDPHGNFRRQEWREPKDLKDLFQSESLDSQYGKFFDQRYIDYLHTNFNLIDKINWRKFEGLTCEYFERVGFFVEIGPGRNDEGIDARIWPTETDKNKPPLIIVQCKREKRKIQKMVVKALYADIVEEKADSGLIVATSCLSPGAQKTLTTRSYPIKQANRDTLRTWITSMHTPNNGIFLGE